MNTKVKSFFDRRISQEVNMSATQTVELVKKLSNGKPLTEKTASELLDYIGNQNGNLATKQDINWLKWSVGAGFAIFTVFLSAVLTVMVYLHSDTKGEITEIRTEITEIRTELTEIRTELTELRTELTEIKKLIIERIGRK